MRTAVMRHHSSDDVRTSRQGSLTHGPVRVAHPAAARGVGPDHLAVRQEPGQGRGAGRYHRARPGPSWCRSPSRSTCSRPTSTPRWRPRRPTTTVRMTITAGRETAERAIRRLTTPQPACSSRRPAMLPLGSSGATLIAAAEAEAVEIPVGAESFLVERGVDITGMQQAAFDAGMRVDGLAAMMFLLVTFVSLMVHIYSVGYMEGDPRFTWFFTLLSVFTMSMLILVISNNLMLMLVGWELVGVCSFLLIGFWWEEKANSSAAMKAFLTTKFGDVGLVVGIIALWGMFRTFDIGEIIAMVDEGVQAGGAALDSGLLTFALIAMFVRRDRQVGAVPAAHLAARRDGRPHAGQRTDPCGHDGDRRRVHDRPAVPGVLGVADRQGCHSRDRGDHTGCCRVARAGAGRRQARAGLLDRVTAGLHGRGAVVQLHGRHLPPVHPRGSSRRCSSWAPDR